MLKKLKKHLKHGGAAKTEKQAPEASSSFDAVWSDFKKTPVTQEMWNAVFVIVAGILILAFAAMAASLAANMQAVSVSAPMPVAASQAKPISEITTLTEKFVADNMVAPGVDVQVKDVALEGDLYKLSMSLTADGETYDVDAYVTKDGKYIFYKWLDMTAPAATPTPEPVAAAFNAPDAVAPNVKFFVMSFCPYGVQAEQALDPVYRLLAGKASFEQHFVIYPNYCGYGVTCAAQPDARVDYCLDATEVAPKYCSMHGVDEVKEDVRQLCVEKYYDDDTLWNYVSAVNSKCTISNIETCWKTAAATAKVDVAKITACQANEATALLAADTVFMSQYEVSGSPTVFINDVQYTGTRTADAMKSGVCSGFTSQPGECDSALSSTAVASTGSC